MKNILSYDKFSMNEGIINTIKRYISKKQDLDDVVEGIFKKIKSNFYKSELEYKSDDSDGESINKNNEYDSSISYKFNDSDILKVGIKYPLDEDDPESEGWNFYIKDTYLLFINDDNITNLVNKHLIKEIYDFLTEKSQKKYLDLKKADEYNIGKKIKNRYGENGGSSARPLNQGGYQPTDKLDTSKPPKGDDSEYHDIHY